MKKLFTKYEDDFCDLSFDITNFIKGESEEDGTVFQIEAKAEYEGLECSITIAVVCEGEKEMIGYDENEKEMTFNLSSGRLYFTSNGDTSDNFVKTLSKLYKIEHKGQKMVNQIPSYCLSLEGDIEKIEIEDLKLKCFFNDGSFDEDDDNLYAEIFVNISMKNKTLEIAEKDMDYRENIVNIFFG